jgi:hypothetical protein
MAQFSALELSYLPMSNLKGQWKAVTIWAFVVGLCSGPAAYGVAIFSADNHLAEETKELLTLFAVAAVLVAAFVFAIYARLQLPANAAWGPRLMAKAAIVAPIVWTIIIIALIVYSIAHMDT